MFYEILAIVLFTKKFENTRNLTFYFKNTINIMFAKKSSGKSKYF